MNHKRISNAKVLIFVVILSMASCLSACSSGKPQVYTEAESFYWDAYKMKLDENAGAEIYDFLCRTTPSGQVFHGSYELYNSKLILKNSSGEIKLYFTKDGRDWVFNEKKSSGTGDLGFAMDDKAVWISSETLNDMVPPEAFDISLD